MMEESERETPKSRAKEIEEKILAGERWVKQGHYSGADVRWKQWERNARYLRCLYDDDWTKGQFSTFNVNSIYANYHAKKPTLYFKNPKISATPTKPEFSRDQFGNVQLDEKRAPKLVDNYNAARLFGVKINYELREIKFKDTVKAVIGDNLCPYGIGWVKWGYKEITAGGHSNQRGTQVSYWCKRVDPRNIVYDWMATSMTDCKWIAERLILTRQQAKALGFKIPKDYISSLPEFLKERQEKAEKQQEDENLVIVWEFHDLVKKSIHWCLVDDKNGGTSAEVKTPTEDPYTFDGSCYVPLVLDPDHDDIIGMSDVEPIEDQALALNRMRTMEVKHVDNFGTTIFTEEGAISEAEAIKYERTPFGGRVTLKPGMLSKFQVVTTPSLGADHYNLSAVHKDEMRTTLGITDYQQGGAKSRTATEGNIIQNAANIRIEEQRDVIYDFIIECIRRLAAMIQSFSTEEEYLNLKDEQIDDDYVEVLKKDYGYNPKIPFLKMSRKDIQGEFNFEFQIEDMIVRPKEIQIQQLNASLAAVGGNPVFAQKFIEEYDVAKVINKIFELNGVDIKEFRKGGPAMIPVEHENMMFQSGMEVPEPHRKDNDDEHIISHGRMLRELEGQLQQSMMQSQQATAQHQQMMTQMMGSLQIDSPEMAQAAQMKAQETDQQFQMMMQQQQDALLPMQDIVRKLKIHMQMHDQLRMKKETEGMSSGGGMPGPQGGPQSAASQQVMMQQQAQQVQ